PRTDNARRTCIEWLRTNRLAARDYSGGTVSFSQNRPCLFGLWRLAALYPRVIAGGTSVPDLRCLERTRGVYPLGRTGLHGISSTGARYRGYPARCAASSRGGALVSRAARVRERGAGSG